MEVGQGGEEKKRADEDGNRRCQMCYSSCGHSEPLSVWLWTPGGCYPPGVREIEKLSLDDLWLKIPISDLETG